MIRFIFGVMLLGAVFGDCKAQQLNNIDKCGTMANLSRLENSDVTLHTRMNSMEEQIQRYINNLSDNRMNNSTITIPVIVHVVYHNASQNIDDSLITSQIDVLNEDYNIDNSDNVNVLPYFKSRIGNTSIRFALATKDPNGNSTSGIRRVQTSVSSFTIDDKVKHTSQGGDDAWDAARYFNVWVCNLSGGTLGYSQFPGGANATDGCVIQYDAFGRISTNAPFNYGRTLTHESGHWLNLYHIWGDALCGNDSVADTPTQTNATFGPQNCQRISCSNGPDGDCYMDFMDYTDDQFMLMFTQGQVIRMQAVINIVRSSLATSNGLDLVSPLIDDAGISAILSPVKTPCDNTSQAFKPIVTLTNWGSNNLTSVTIHSRIDFNNSSTFNWSGNLAPGASNNVSLPLVSPGNTGDHIFYSWTSNPNGTADSKPSNDRSTSSFIIKDANATFPVNVNFESTTFPPVNWKVGNYDCTTPWQRTTNAFHSGSASAYVNNFSNTTTVGGHLQDLITQPLDLTTGSWNPSLSFWIAYAPKTSITDTFEVLVSTDCGYTFTSIYRKWGNALQTSSPQNTAFVPNASQWRNEIIDLTPFNYAKNAIIYFRNITNMANNLYLDDINILPTGIPALNFNPSINIYPNPNNGNYTLAFNRLPMQSVFQIVDVLGQVVYHTETNSTEGTLSIHANSLNNGVYLWQILSNQHMMANGKLVIIK